MLSLNPLSRITVQCWLLPLLLFFCSLISVTNSFAPQPRVRYVAQRSHNVRIESMNQIPEIVVGHPSKLQHPNSVLFSSSSNQDKDTTKTSPGDSQQQQDRLTQLGYSTDEIERSSKKSKLQTSPLKVAVTEVEVDPLTLTALGFALIAINFLVFANMGSGGIAGIVASIMNTWDN